MILTKERWLSYLRDVSLEGISHEEDFETFRKELAIAVSVIEGEDPLTAALEVAVYETFDVETADTVIAEMRRRISPPEPLIHFKLDDSPDIFFNGVPWSFTGDGNLKVGTKKEEEHLGVPLDHSPYFTQPTILTKEPHDWRLLRKGYSVWARDLSVCVNCGVSQIAADYFGWHLCDG